MEDFYRDSRRRLGLLMEGPEPEGGRWNFDADNREPPPRGPGHPRRARAALAGRGRDRRRRSGATWTAGQPRGSAFVGEDGPRLFAATRTEALAALDHFVEHRLAAFGRHEDAVLGGDRWMAHSLLSAPMNLGLLDPLEVVQRAEEAYRDAAPHRSPRSRGSSARSIGWRDYVWHLYWHLGPGYRRRNALRRARAPCRRGSHELDADGDRRRAACRTRSTSVARARLGAPHPAADGARATTRCSAAGTRPQVTDWFHRASSTATTG